MNREEQELVERLLHDDGHFKHLYDKHHDLKQRVAQAQRKDPLLDDLSLEQLKKEKLLLKDQMAEIITDARKGQA